MTNKDLDPTWAEFKRLGITARTLKKLVHGGQTNPDAASANVAMSIGPEAWSLMKSLPDGVGEEAFIEAFKAKFPEFR